VKALLLSAYDQIVQRDPYVALGSVTASMMGQCSRQVSYALRDGQPEREDDPDGSPTAYLGTAIHERLLPDLAEILGGEIEQEVSWDSPLGLVITGHADLVTPTAVVDVKTVSGRYYPIVLERPPRNHLWQVLVYALAAEKDEGYLLYVNRDTGERFVREVDFAEHLPVMLDWLGAAAVGEPEEHVREQRGPDLSIICDSCPWVEECWGHGPVGRLPQSVIVGEVGVETALRNYADARYTEGQAKADKEFWRSVIAGHEPGAYGGFSLSWRGSDGETPVIDGDAAKAMLESYGLDVPYKIRRTSATIDVRAVKPEEEA